MTRAGIIAALAVAAPTLGLLASITLNEAQSRGATEWRIPITGYDPRDPLRGRYIAFRYDWAVEGTRTACPDGDCVLCIGDYGRHVRIEPKGAACPARIDPMASGLSVTYLAEAGRPRATAATRLWVSESRAPALERQLLTGRMVAVARLTRGGRLVARRLEPAR